MLYSSPDERKEGDNNVCYISGFDWYQIRIKIDMYGQEHRLSSATPIFRRFDVWYVFRIPVPFPAFLHPLEYLQSRHRNSRCQYPVSVSRLFSRIRGLRFYPQRYLRFQALARQCGYIFWWRLSAWQHLSLLCL